MVKSLWQCRSTAGVDAMVVHNYLSIYEPNLVQLHILFVSTQKEMLVVIRSKLRFTVATHCFQAVIHGQVN